MSWRVWLGFRHWQGTGKERGIGEQGRTGRDPAGTREQGSAGRDTQPEERPSLNWGTSWDWWGHGGTRVGPGIRKCW